MEYVVEVKCPDHPNTWHEIAKKKDPKEAEDIAKTTTAQRGLVTRVVAIERTTNVVFRPACELVII